MKVLAIETSCDETSAAIVENGTKILSNVVASSVELHAKTGGVIPEIAAREQLKCMLPVLSEALQRANTNHAEIDTIAVTVGPGLIGSLLVGIETAKTLAYFWKKPIIPVNHLLAHIYANWLDDSGPTGPLNNWSVPEFPLLALVVSGGHTELVLLKNHGQIEWIGGTRDDAAGECFDKTARLLGLGYPGGPVIAAAASKYRPSETPSLSRLPRPMANEDNFDFSFSGLKTAVLREVQNLQKKEQLNHLAIGQLSFEIQEAISDVLVDKIIRAAKKYKVKSLLLAGGVSANSRLREKFGRQLITTEQKFHLFIPQPKLCTDNAAPIAACAFFNYHPVPWQEITVSPGLTINGEN